METFQFSFALVLICYSSALIPVLRIVYINSARLSEHSELSHFRFWAPNYVIIFFGTFKTLVILAGGASLAFYHIAIPPTLFICLCWEIMYFTEATQPQDEEDFIRNLLLTSLGVFLWLTITFIALLRL